MSRGRKPKLENTNLNWQEYFNKNVGVYLQSIITELGQLKICGNENSTELLKQIKKTNVKGAKLPDIGPEEIPFMIPRNWVWCRLGEIIEFTDNTNIEKEFSRDTLINYVDIDAIDNKNYTIRENKLKPVAELSSRARRVLRKGYLVYSLVRPYLNNIAIVEEEYPNHIGSTGLAVFNGILVNNKYLKYILLSDYVRQLYLSMLSGFNSPTITIEQFNSTPIPLPPISEQNKILYFLSDLENENIKSSVTYFNKEVEEKILDIHNSQLLSSELLSELSYQLTLIENLNQAILQEAVQGKLVPQDPKDEPAGELLKRIKAEKEKSGKKEKPLPPIKPEEIPFEIPGNWVWCRLGDLAMYSEAGKSFKCEEVPIKNDEWGVIKVSAISWDKFLEDQNKLYSKNTPSDLSAKIKVGDFIISRANTSELVGKSVVVKTLSKNLLLSDKTIRFKFSGHINIDFINIVNNSYYSREYYSKMGTGTSPSMKNITREHMNNLLIPLPPLSEQKRIVSEIEKQLAKTKQLQEHIIANQQATEQLLKALLHQAFEPGQQVDQKSLTATL